MILHMIGKRILLRVALTLAVAAPLQLGAQSLKDLLKDAAKGAASEYGKKIERENGFALLEGGPIAMKEAVKGAIAEGFETVGGPSQGMILPSSENSNASAKSSTRLVSFAGESRFEYRVVAQCPGCEQFQLDSGDDAVGEPATIDLIPSAGALASVRLSRGTCAARHDGACIWYLQLLRRPRSL